MSESQPQGEGRALHTAAFYAHSALMFSAIVATVLIVTLSFMTLQTRSAVMPYFASAWLTLSGLWSAAAYRFYREDAQQISQMTSEEQQGAADSTRPHLRLVKCNG